MIRLLELKGLQDRDAVAVRQTARRLTRLLGFENQDQIRITTAVSELLRAATGEEGGEAVVEFLVKSEARRQRLVVRVSSPHLGGDSAGSATLAAQRLLDRIDEPGSGSGAMSLARVLPPDAPAVDAVRAAAIRKELEHVEAAGGYLAELKQQNRELSSTLLELERKQQELTRLNLELADTNRGVMALYAELDERANHLRQADELKTKFFSNMSHELRTPLSSIVGLANLLLSQCDGPLSSEQAKQLQLIRNSAAELFDVVSDMLDLAKVEAGKTPVNLSRFSVGELFGALRGMVRPLLISSAVSLELENPADLPLLIGDEAKVTQVLRNFLSNAVKFTQQGSIRVSARLVHGGERPPGQSQPAAQESIVFCVADTGIGIGRDHREMIFDEFTQVTHPLQRTVRGTGLGLPLCRKLAALMGGRVWVDSELGKGSSFYFMVPRLYRPGADRRVARTGPRSGPDAARDAAAPEPTVLIVSDVAEERVAIGRRFDGSGLEATPVAASELTADYVATARPTAIVADSSAAALVAAALEPGPNDRVPVIWLPSHRGAGNEALAAAGPSAADEDVVEAVYRGVLKPQLGRVLLVDDDETFQTIMSKQVAPYCGSVLTTGDPENALATVAAGDVDCAIIDLMMPEVDGLTLLTMLRDNPATERLPVLVCSSKALSADERAMLHGFGASFLAKNDIEPRRLARGLIEARDRAPSPSQERINHREN